MLLNLARAPRLDSPASTRLRAWVQQRPAAFKISLLSPFSSASFGVVDPYIYPAQILSCAHDVSHQQDQETVRLNLLFQRYPSTSGYHNPCQRIAQFLHLRRKETWTQFDIYRASEVRMTHWRTLPRGRECRLSASFLPDSLAHAVCQGMCEQRPINVSELTGHGRRVSGGPRRMVPSSGLSRRIPPSRRSSSTTAQFLPVPQSPGDPVAQRVPIGERHTTAVMSFTSGGRKKRSVSMRPPFFPFYRG